MISVFVPEAAQPVVREFFELFKTPWRFYEADAPARILLCAPAGRCPRIDAALVILFAGDLMVSDAPADATCGSPAEPGLFNTPGSRCRLYGCRLLENTSGQIVFQRGQSGAIRSCASSLTCSRRSVTR